MGAGAGDSVRLELLGIIFNSVDLPEDYARACFIMWMRQEGIEKQFVGERVNDVHLTNAEMQAARSK